MQNYYEILGVQKTATATEIKKAFYTLSKKYHPDITGSNEAATKEFVRIKEAYDVLKDKEKRQAYDSGFTGGSYSGFGQGYNQSPFPGNDFKQWKSGNWHYTYYRKNPGSNFTNEDFQRIWKEFQRKAHENADYDQMFRERRQQAWDEFSRKREEAWRRRAEEYARKYPFDNVSNFPKFNWERFNKFMALYVTIFFLVGIFQAFHKSEKSVVKNQEKSSVTPNQTLQEMIYRPPVNYPKETEKNEQSFDRPFGFPENRKDY
uniref:J domain-containing protein n=1 Tax=Panagrolaimus sp. JU765 TaxID=591449 RepID=A0AC34RBR3_9BILA